MTLLVTVGPILDQDLGKSIDLLHHAVDLSVLLAADRDVGQRPREEMAGRSQGLQEPVGDLPSHEAPELSRMTVSHEIASRFRICFSRWRKE
jgi:hypothetical protein